MYPVISSDRCRHSKLFWSAPLEEFAQRFGEQVQLFIEKCMSMCYFLSVFVPPPKITNDLIFNPGRRLSMFSALTSVRKN